MPAPVKDSPYLHRGKLFSRKGVYEHERHHRAKNSGRRKRSFGKKTCTVCGKQFHAAGLRSHMATQHSLDFAREKARRKPSSRAARRREMLAHAEETKARRHQRSTSLKSTGDHKHSPHRHATPPAVAAEPRTSSKLAQSNKPAVSRTSGSATRRAWKEMEHKMSKAASK